MKKIPVISFVLLLVLAVTPCSAQKAQAPLAPAPTQSKKQDQTAQFTHAEMVQFLHTVQTQAAGWKDTVSSINPSVLQIYGEAAMNVEGHKSNLLDYLNHIGELWHRSNEINKALDLDVEFQVFSDLCEVGDIISELGDTLSRYAPSGQLQAAELLQIKKEVFAAKLTLFKEILNRILNTAKSESSGACP